MADIAVYAFTCGWISMSKKAVIDDGAGKINMPIPAFLIRHPKGDVLFDTGLHAELVDPASTRLGELRKYSTLTFAAGDYITDRLATLGLEPASVKMVINSHLHFDHAGGNDSFPNARFLVQRVEWEAAHNDEMIRKVAYNPDDYRACRDVQCIDGEHDVFGDNTLMLIPTPGHTPGHQSALIRSGNRKVVLLGDACYTRENYDRRSVSRLSWDLGVALQSVDRLRALQQDGWEMVFGHDPESWASVPQAPKRLL